MKRRLLFLLLSLWCLTLSAAAAEESGYQGWIVQLRPEAVSALLSEEGTVSRYIVADTLEEAREIPPELVEYIEPNYIIELFDAGDGEGGETETPENPGEDEEPDGPNDPLYEAYQWNLRELHFYEAYRQGLRGQGVTVGFVDSGINADHEDLRRENISGVNFHGDGLPYNEDSYGHGTFAAGIIAARTDNGVGLAGIAPEISVRAYRVFNQRNSTTAAVVQAIDQAVADGCQVLNLSLGMRNDSTILREAVARAVDSGIIVTAAVGNNGTDVIQYPAGYPGVIGVGSVDAGGTVSSFSQRNETVDFTAPAGGIPGLDNQDDSGYKLNLGSGSNRGTSYAAPVVTALAAMALGYDSDLTAEGFFTLLQASAVDLGPEGWDEAYGYGLVDAAAFAEALTRDYGIQYVLNGGSLPEDAVTSFSVGSGTLALPVPVRDGYQFEGWYRDPACQGESVQELPAGSVGEQTFYAKWKRVYTIILAGYRADGRLAGLEFRTSESWNGVLPWEEGVTYRVFFVDSAFRPLPAGEENREPENQADRGG